MRRLLAAAALIAAPAHADALQDQVLAGMRRTDTGNVAFTATTRFERTGVSPHTIVMRFDPRGAGGRQWSVVSYDGGPPTPKQTQGMLNAANRNPRPAYAQLAKWFGAPATRVAERPGSVTYRFARLPAGALKIGSHDASADTMVEATVATGAAPYVTQVRMVSTQGFRMMLVAKVERYVFTATYRLLPDGRPFPAGQDAEVTGAMMGKSGNLTTRTRYDAR